MTDSNDNSNAADPPGTQTKAEVQQTVVPKRSNNLSRWKRWTFRLLAVLIGLMPLLILELVLLVIGWQPASVTDDPYVGFASSAKLFSRSEDGRRMEIGPKRQPLFCADSFLRTKPESGFRIFLIGGSTVQGRPFAIETSFVKWMQLGLEVADPEHQYELVNCGGVSYASYRLAPIVDEVLNYEPNLIVIYTGHNEFLEDRTYAQVRQTSQWVTDTHHWLTRFQSYQWIRSWFLVRQAGTPRSSEKTDAMRAQLPADVEARLDFAGGLSLYQRDEAWQSGVIEHYHHNVRRMVVACQQAQVPVVLINPVANLRDARPFKSESRAGLSEEQLSTFRSLMKSIERQTVPSQADLERDRDTLQQAVKLDPWHAMAQFRLGQTHWQLGDWDRARACFLAAKEEDVCPLRILEPMRQRLNLVARNYSVPMIDANQYFVNQSPDGIVGAESLVDHVHPTIAGHQQLAGLVLESLAKRNLVPVTTHELTSVPFRSRRDQVYRSHLAELPFMYFELGKDRLDGLKRWASGQVRRQRAPAAVETGSDRKAQPEPDQQ